jgi:YidC/Oxa1 family membrane protein insertase
MELWMQWLNVIQTLLDCLSSTVGLGTGLGIVALTLFLRTVILPISWSSAYRACIRQKKMFRLQPQLERLKQDCGAHPQLYAERVMNLYRDNGMSVMDLRSLVGALLQMPIFLGMYQTLRAGAHGGRFLWVQSLARPDVWLALLVGLTTMWMMSANPDLPEQMRLILIMVPSVLAVVAALKFCSALAVYWTVSNSYSAVQTWAMHRVVARRIKSGSLTI